MRGISTMLDSKNGFLMRSSSHETHGQPAPHADAGLETAPFRLPWICGLLRFSGICHIAGGAVALFAAPSILRVFGVCSFAES